MLPFAGCQRASVSNDATQAKVVPPGVIPVQVIQQQGQAQLLRGGKPYYIKGAAGLQHYEAIQQAGGNSVRLWTTDYADTLMDAAHQHNISVMLGIWLAREQEGFDYYDEQQVKRQREFVRKQVMRFRRHPALLMWNLGNEMDLNAKNPKVYEAINHLAQMIHELDPYHPVTTTLSGNLGMIQNVKAWCPAIDILSVNAFGSLEALPEDLRSNGWTKPYIVTEYGGLGYWESPTTIWNAPLEQSSTNKAENLRKAYVSTIQAARPQCIGSYAFYWGQKFEFTNTWFGLFTPEGEKTAVVDVLQELWTGQKPANLSPKLEWLVLNKQEDSSSVQLPAGSRAMAYVGAKDPEGDTLTVRWEVRPDKPLGERYEERSTPTEPLPNVIQEASGLQALVVIPRTPGSYRLSVTVSDGKGSAATANLPFRVKARPRPIAEVSFK
ncbi:glycoside hydrolase family 2 TIM barrel-domain containing protein [Hymenobacter sp. BT730]|uniref:glycoside hydrolase family 2 TIM barrel-domain containing protein n=1 Tax=Hymenobacter sp. BT730 TaxID=3063332 RepID=UPI0026E07D03|nr:glycoside hydrolase family 2 TIM barrel-domain containing protein [Hymenobacter sp. BT730]